MTVPPGNVHKVIARYMLADGFDLVLDLRKSKGLYLYNSRTKRKMLDFFSFFASLPVGHNHPKMIRKSFIKKLGEVAVNKPANSDLYTQEMADFVGTFSKIARPKYMKHFFFISGGALGVENALKTAFDWKVRKNFNKGHKKEVGMKVIHLQQSFHGRTGYTLSLTNTADPRKTNYFPKFKWPRVLNPKARFPLKGKNLKGTREAENKSLDQINKAIERYKDDISAFIMEPIQGEGGDNHFRKQYHRAVERMCRQNDIMFIVDEVQSGVGLTGKMWAHQNYDVVPDMIAFGKKTQVCGCMVGSKVDEIEDNVFNVSSRLNSTWGGNLVDMVRSQRYFEIIKEERLVENARRRGKHLLQNLQELEDEFPDIISNARGVGLMCAIDTPSTEYRTRLHREIYKRDMVILACGHTSIRFRPTLTIKDHHIDKGVNIIRRALRSMK
jgi:L-lysine 6-transaminase